MTPKSKHILNPEKVSDTLQLSYFHDSIYSPEERRKIVFTHSYNFVLQQGGVGEQLLFYFDDNNPNFVSIVIKLPSSISSIVAFYNITNVTYKPETRRIEIESTVDNLTSLLAVMIDNGLGYFELKSGLKKGDLNPSSTT